VMVPNFGHIWIEPSTDDRSHQGLIVGVDIGPAVQNIAGVKEMPPMQVLGQLTFLGQTKISKATGYITDPNQDSVSSGSKNISSSTVTVRNNLVR
jgi:hypothetical protein